MSLLPNEQRALDRIEESLASSAPRLATMLTTFKLPVTGGLAACGLARLGRRLLRSRRARWLAVISVVLAMAALITAAWLTG